MEQLLLAKVDYGDLKMKDLNTFKSFMVSFAMGLVFWFVIFGAMMIDWRW